MGLLQKLRKRFQGAKPRSITGPKGWVRQCPDCLRDLEVVYLVGNGDGTATVGMVCLKCGDPFEEVTRNLLLGHGADRSERSAEGSAPLDRNH